MLSKLKQELNSLKDPKQAQLLQRFFKTGVGEYGEGDVFLGLNSAQIKDISKKYPNLDLNDIQNLLNSKIHEERVCALRILIHKYNKADIEEKKQIFYFYLNNSKKINNWDLVDISAHRIIGDYLLKDYSKKEMLYKLAQSHNLWEKRISIVSTFAFIKEKKFDDSLALAEILLGDSHDLIHKAVGWVLREIGKYDEKLLEDFLKKHYDEIPRTTLRYSIEKFEEGKRKKYLRGEF